MAEESGQERTEEANCKTTSGFREKGWLKVKRWLQLHC